VTVTLAATAEFARQMRIGSLEITAALAAVALLAARPRVRAAAEIGALSPMQIDLEILERGAHRTLRLRSPFEVGRDKAADVALRDPEVSRRHARFQSEQGVVYVDDLKSRNGTFLNGRRVTEAIEVRGGDEIDVGTTRILVTGVRAG
jgi:FHA domain